MSPDSTGLKHSPILIATSVFAVLWVTARACVQSITIDEADSYTTYWAFRYESDFAVRNGTSCERQPVVGFPLSGSLY
jgi:hypothetical protein